VPYEDVNQDTEIILVEEMLLRIRVNIQRLDDIEPVIDSGRILLLVNQVQQVLHEVIGVIGKCLVLFVLPH
jgi:hypothetical protein